MLPLFRANPGLAISLGLLGGGLLVSALLGFIMARSGASLRPIYWFASLFPLVVGPQVAFHFHGALQTVRDEARHTAALEQLATPTGINAAARREDATCLFGPDADPQLISDVSRAYGDVFTNARSAQFAMLPEGGTVLLAHFKSSGAAEDAWVAYLRTSGLNQLGGEGDSQRGYVVTRPVGDRAFILHSGTMLGVWTGRDDAAIRGRMIAGGFDIPRRAPLGGATPAVTTNAPSARMAPAFIGVGIALYLLVVVLYFFKGSAWAGTFPAEPGVPSLAASELAVRLEAINALDVPFSIERGAQPNELFATWRYADAKWIDLARVRGMRRTFRIRLLLDEKTGTVRATDYFASFDCSAGRGGADLEWKTGVGIVLFQKEQQRVFGLQIDEQGHLKPELSYSYKFDLNEMKSPLVQAVTRAGWSWRPTIWQGPTWLRWLTE
jgi:hypothetical protein